MRRIPETSNDKNVLHAYFILFLAIMKVSIKVRRNGRNHNTACVVKPVDIARNIDKAIILILLSPLSLRIFSKNRSWRGKIA
jgi:hypothetical protein